MWVSYKFGYYISTPYAILFGWESIYYFPIDLGSVTINMPWLNRYIFVISVIGFSVYLICTTCKKNQSLYDGMLGNLSRFHFIPLLLIASIYIIALNSNNEDSYKYFRKLLIFDLIFTILGLISLIFIYIVTQLNTEWYFVLSIKKGMYSTFIIFLWYNFLHTIVSLQAFNYLINDVNHYSRDKNNSIRKFFKGIGIPFTILFGLGSLVFSVLFKDTMAAFTTFLIYLGMIESFFNGNKYDEEERKELFNGNADGALDIIFMILSLACIFFLALKCRERIF
jgi:hypothetical protein